jgi:RNA polymerase sigma factor (sigma-70 family)
MIPSEYSFENLVHSKIALDGNISGMSEREKRILNLSASGKKQYQIAEEMGLSQPYISRILKKIRENLSK